MNPILMIHPGYIVLIILGILTFLFLFFYFLPIYVVAHVIYKDKLVRTNQDKWSRKCSCPNDEEQVEMFEIGLKWAEQYKDNIKEVDIYNDGFHLFGELFDLNKKKTAIILPGRMESLLYSYYYAKPYVDAGFNVLVIDTRSHGLSEGKYNSVGLLEYRDVIAWIKMLEDKFNQEEVVIHGVCIGASTGVFAVVDKDAPKSVKGIVVDGMYQTFYETFRTHVKEEKKPGWPFLNFIMHFMKRDMNVDAKNNGPIYVVDKIQKPILFIYSLEDKFSLPQKSEELVKKCQSKQKEVKVFEHGGHSHVRINNQEEYDKTIQEFLKKYNL